MRPLMIAALACFMLLGFSSAWAHAPKDVGLEFDVAERMLTVNFTHQVKDAGKHYVNQVTVELNGKTVIEQKLAAQENLESGMVVYRLTDAGVGDVITVTAACNVSGKKKASIEIAPPPEKGKEQP